MNERLRVQQLQLERCGEALIKRCVSIFICHSRGSDQTQKT